jgi:peptidase E
VIETMEANKADMIAVAPNLREFSAAGLNKKYDFSYHPGALKYFKDKNIQAKAFE